MNAIDYNVVAENANVKLDGCRDDVEIWETLGGPLTDELEAGADELVKRIGCTHMEAVMLVAEAAIERRL